MKNKANRILMLVFLIGLGILLYPSVSDYWNSFHQTKAIMDYESHLAAVDAAEYQRIWSAAEAYNEALRSKPNRYVLSAEEQAAYERQLAVDDSAIMGYIEIPTIRCSLPIYHGMDEGTLQSGIGHIPGTSLPVGGAGTHCVLSGHRGLPSSKLFTNLDRLVEGDLFYLQIMNQTLAYEVDQILIVTPEEMTALAIEEGQDYCTLVTCTPYGINSHRLLVRGHRVEDRNALQARVTADAMQWDPVLVAPLFAAPVLALLLLWVLVHYRKK